MSKTKVCSYCGKRKDKTCFSVKSNATDNLRSYCKLCATTMMRNYRKTGKSKDNEYGYYNLKSLQIIIDSINIQAAKFGYKFEKVKTK